MTRQSSKLILSVFSIAAALLLVGGMFWLVGGPGVTSARAASYTVTKFTDSNDGTCDADCSLREAIRAANTNVNVDTIILAAGTYTLSLFGLDNTAALGDLDITNPLTITGQGAGVTIIRQTVGDRVFDARSAVVTPQIAIQNLTITGGNTVIAAGMYINHGTVLFEGVEIVENDTSNNGGGLYVNRGNVTISGGAILTNTAPGNGGGIFVYDSTAQVWVTGGTLISGNTADGFGGGVYIEDGKVEMGGFQLVHNSGYYGGGAMAYGDDAFLTLSNGLVAYNFASENGGGVSTYNGQATLEQVGVIHNHAENIGGGLTNDYGKLYLTNVTVSDNTALVKTSVGGGGGGIYASGSAIWYSRTEINFSTIANNSTPEEGGGILLGNANAFIKNSIVANNTGENCVVWANGTLTSEGANFEDTDDCEFDQPTDHPATNPELTALTAGVHPLAGNSPAIDTAPCDAAILVDQRGMARPFGAACDSGAYEAAPAPLTGVSISGPATGLFGQTLNFSAIPEPVDAAGPIVYTWTPAPLTGQGTAQVTYRWFEMGEVEINLSAVGTGAPVASAPHAVTIGGELIFLPLVVR